MKLKTGKILFSHISEDQTRNSRKSEMWVTLCIGVAALLWLLLSTIGVQANVQGSPHDFTTATGGALQQSPVDASAADLLKPYVIQLLSSVDAINPSSLPVLPAFQGRRLYISHYEKEGTRWNRLRLGFFPTAAAARDALGPIAAEYPGAWIAKSSAQEKQASATSAISATGDTDETCVFCHTPQGSDSAAAPLWDRKSDAVGFSMYSGGTTDITIDFAPQGVSLICLSCHDGTIGSQKTFTGADNMAGRGFRAVLGNYLRTPHPIFVAYDSTDIDFVAPTNLGTKIVVGTLPLYGALFDQIECGTCHDPHTEANPSFLRLPEIQLCVTCHDR